MDGRACRGWKEQRSGSGDRGGDVMPLPPPRKVLYSVLCSSRILLGHMLSGLVEANSAL